MAGIVVSLAHRLNVGARLLDGAHALDVTNKFATLNFEEALIGLIAARHKVAVGASFFLHVSSSNQYLSIVAQPVRSTVHVPAFFPRLYSPAPLRPDRRYRQRQEHHRLPVR